MSYPGENTHKAYLDYVMAQQENGQAALPKSEWLKQQAEAKKSKKDDKPKSPSDTEPMSSILRPGSKGILKG